MLKKRIAGQPQNNNDDGLDDPSISIQQQEQQQPEKSKKKSPTRLTTITCRLLLVGIFAFCFTKVSIGNLKTKNNNGQENSLSKSNVQRLRQLDPSRTTNNNYNIENTGEQPPPTMIVHGKRSEYTRVPSDFYRKYYTTGKGRSHMHRAFNNNGWKFVENASEAQIYHKMQGGPFSILEELLPWQRYSRIPGYRKWDAKDGFLNGFRQYQQKYGIKSLNFLPETYELQTKQGRIDFIKALDAPGGRNRPWVLKKVSQNNGKGIEILAPNSIELETAVNRSMADFGNRYIVQAYICNELTWFNGEKFDLRFYWMIASVDPVIALFHDGYVRVGGALYNETDFSSTGQHLTNHKYRTANQTNVTSNYLWQRISEHYQEKRHILAPRISDPVAHVRNQMKEAIGTLLIAFKDVFPDRTIPSRVENLYSFYGADFVIDQDLDVYFIEAQTSPGVPSKYEYQIELYGELFTTMIGIIDEISSKQQADASANLLPIKAIAKWDLVYADTWRYSYKDYNPVGIKVGCPLSSTATS